MAKRLQWEGGRETLIGTDGHRRSQSFLGLPNLHPFMPTETPPSSRDQSPSPSDPPIRFFSPYQKTEPSGLSSVLVKPSHFVSLVSRYFFFASGEQEPSLWPRLGYSISFRVLGLDLPDYWFLDRRKRGAQFPPPDPCSLIAAMSNTLLRVYPSDLKMPCKCLYYMDILATVLQHIGLIGSWLPSVCLMP